MTLPRPRTALECLQVVHLQPHEQEMLAERIEQYARMRATEAQIDGINQCRAAAQRILNAPMTEAELGEPIP